MPEPISSVSSVGIRARADPGRVGLHDPDHLVDLERSDAATGAGAAGDRIGRGDVRIAAVVDVEERALGSLEDDVVSTSKGVLDQPGGVGQVGSQALAPGHRLGDQRFGVEGRRPGHRREQRVLVRQDPGQAVAEGRLVEQVLHPEAEARRPVGIGGSDPAVRRPDLLAVESRLHRPVQGDVVRHDHVGVATDPDLGGVDAPGRQHVELTDQGRRVDHDPRADDAGDVGVEHARRRQPELEHLVPEDDRVPGVVAALVADGHRDLLGEEVGRLALALVAPLEPDDHGGRHQTGSPGRWPARRADRWPRGSSDVKKPPADGPRTGIDCSLRRAVGVPTIPRAMGVRLTGRTFLERWD